MERFNQNVLKKIKPINRLLRLFVHEEHASTPVKIDDIKEILIIEVSLIGDEIMTIPFYSCLKANCPNARVTVVGRKWVSSQLLAQGLIDRIIEFDALKCLSSPVDWIKNYRTIKGVLTKINTQSYDVDFEPRGDIRYALFMHFTTSDRKISFVFMDNAYMLTDAVEPDADIVHEIPHRLSLLKKTGFDTMKSPIYPVLRTTKKQELYNENYIKKYDLEGKNIIGIHPGASLKDKQYKKFPEVISLIADKMDKGKNYILIFCGKGEEKMAGKVLLSARNHRLNAHIVNENLENYIGLLSVCNYMICNDSGAGHIAAAYGIPVTVVFGPVLAEMYAPMGENAVFTVSHNLPCKPCRRRECPNGDNICLTEIEADEVATVVEKMIRISERKR